MAKLKKEDFISALKEMTILEVKELVDAMKEEFGVDPMAVAVAAAPAAAAVDEGPSTRTVVLKSAGGNKIAVIKIIKENIPADEAEAIKTQLTEAGAEVELV